MSAEKTDALILRIVEFSETSCVLTLFTRDFGKISGLAKGARRPKGPFESAIDLLARCRIVFLRKSGDALDLLTEAKLERRFRVVGSNLGALYAGYYVAELLLALTDDDDPHVRLFDEAATALERFSAPRPGENVVGRQGDSVDWLARCTFHFELAALALLGHLPSLAECVECGEKVKGERRVWFGHLAGGALCAKCRPGQRKVVSVSVDAIEAMKRLAELDDEAWIDWPIDAKVRGEIRGILNHYLAHLAGRPMKMLRYLSV